MKKLLLLCCLLLSHYAVAQMTSLSATVVDSDNVAWANGSWKLAFTPNPSHPNIGDYNINGTPLAPGVTNQSGSLDSAGKFTASIYNNNVVTPAGSGWLVTVCPLAS